MNTIFNFALIPFIGAFGASIATMLGYMAIWVIRTIQLRKIICIKVAWSSQIIGFFILLMQCAVSLIFKQFYFQIPFLILILISQKSYLMKVLQKIKWK